MKDTTVRVGIIGAGNVARNFHMPGWRRIPQVQVVAVADVNEQSARGFAHDFQVPHWFTDWHRLVEMDAVDVVDICAPNMLHTPMVLESFARDKHVFCEKPLAVTPAEIEQMIAARDRAGRMLMIDQNNRYRGISMAVKRWIDAGHLGDAYYARAWAIRRNLLPCAPGFICKDQSGGGASMDIGVHALDLAMWLMGFPEPVSVTGSASANLARTDFMPGAWGEWNRETFNVEDFACGLVRFANGAMLSLESSWLAHIPQSEDMSCTVLGTRAGVSWPSGVVATSTNGVLVDAAIKPMAAAEPTHVGAISDFYYALVNDLPSPVSAEQSLKVIKILDGIYRSQAAGEEVRV